MTATHDIPLTTVATWEAGGVWVRSRSGPTTRSYTGRVTVGPWHRIIKVGLRLANSCGRGPRGGQTWPSGGLRLEVARPAGLGLPGVVCPHCLRLPVVEEIEEAAVDGDTLDQLTELVLERLIVRFNEQRAEAGA